MFCVDGRAAQAASIAVVSSYYDVARGSGWTVLDGVLQWGPVLDPEQLPVQPMAVIAARALPGPPVDVLVGHNTDEVATFLDGSHYAASYPTLVYETMLLSVFGLRGSSAVKAQYARYGLPAGVEQLDLIMTDYWFKARFLRGCHGIATMSDVLLRRSAPRRTLQQRSAPMVARRGRTASTTTSPSARTFGSQSGCRSVCQRCATPLSWCLCLATPATGTSPRRSGPSATR